MRNFVSPRFLERKLGKELPAKLRFASGKENGGIGVWVCAESGPVTVIVKVIVKVIVSVIVEPECRGQARRQREEKLLKKGSALRGGYLWGRMFLSARTERNQRCAKGCSSDERCAFACAQSQPTPWTPFYGGRPPEGLVITSRRAKCSSVIPFASGLRPYVCKI